MYQELLHVKELHEQTAATALQRSRRKLQDQTAALQRARDQSSHFHTFRLKREQQLFDELKGEAVAVRRIDQMKQRAAMLREQEAALEQAVLGAEQALDAARQELAQASEHYKEAVREQEKFRQFSATLAAQEQQQQERRQENEVEESVTSTYGRQSP